MCGVVVVVVCDLLGLSYMCEVLVLLLSLYLCLCVCVYNVM